MAVNRRHRPDTLVQRHIRQGIVSGIGSPYMQDPKTAAQMAALAGRTPTAGWLCEDASGNMASAFGSSTLTLVNTISAYQARTPYPNKRALAFADSGTGYFYSLSYHDDGATSFAWLLHCRAGTLNAGKFFLGETNGASYYLLSSQATGLQWAIRDGTTTKFAVAVADHSDRDFWVWVSVDRTNDLMWCATRFGSASTDISAVGSLATAATFRMMGFGSVESDLVSAYHFSGTSADGDPSDSLSALARFCSG